MKLKLNMTGIKKNLENIMVAAGTIGAVILSCWLGSKVDYNSFTVGSFTGLEEESSTGYTKGDAIAAVTKSGMYSHDKLQAVNAISEIDEILGTHEDIYYAIEKIARSSMFSHDKLQAIKNLAENA